MARDEEVEVPPFMGVSCETPLAQREQIDLANKLQTLLLKTYELRLESGAISDTGLAALQRLLSANGWALDPKEVPEGLRKKLTTQVSPEELDDDGVLPFPRKVG